MTRKLAVAAALVVGLSGTASAQPIAMATDQPGTTFNTIGTAVATIVSENSPLTIIVRPYAGPAAWLPLLNEGEVSIGAMSAASSMER